MERSTSPLTYKGSISDAITEAQKQKKLFVVYISGEDEISINLERSTWMDLTVAEALSKCCIFLHLMQGTVGASQFSDIYPQKSVPCITVVGYNGVLLWQHEGYISAENLAGSIEKAWAALNIQETAATLLSAALASKKPEPLGSSSHSVAPVEKGVSSTSDVPSTSAEKPTEGSEAIPLTDPNQLIEQRACESRDDQKDVNASEGICSQSDNVDDIKIDGKERSNSATNTTEVPVSRDVDYSGTSNDGDVSIEPQENLTLDESLTTTSKSTGSMTTKNPGFSQITGNEVEEGSHAKKVDGLIDCSNAIKTNDIHLNIRLPNGASLQAKFTVTDKLRSVKNYIDENQTDGIGSYDLAVPYPRKVFNEQEMNSALSELGFASRQALIVVPRHRATARPRGEVPSNYSQHASSGADSSDNNGGYFGHVRRIISYMNPLSYLGGNASSSSPEAAPSGGLWQYRPNPALQNQLSGAAEAPRRPYSSDNQNPTPDGDSVSNTRRRTSRPFGSNIHTLRSSEDEEGPSADRNTFWNGNSTEYGGNDN